MSFSVGAVIIRLVKEFSPDFSIGEELPGLELQCFFIVKKFLEAKAAGSDPWGESEPGERRDEGSGGREVLERGSEYSKRAPIEERRSAEQLRRIIPTTLINEFTERTHNFGAWRNSDCRSRNQKL